MTRRRLLRRFGLNSIQGRLTAIAFLFIIATALAIGIAGFRLTVNFETIRFHDHFSLMADYLANNAELGVLLGNESTLNELTETMLEVSDVQIVEIVDSRGRLITKKSHLKLDTELASVSSPVVSRPMLDGDTLFMGNAVGQENLGHVKIYYSLAGLNQLKKLLAQRFVVVSLVLALVPIICYWMLSRAINAPLTSLLDVAGLVSQGRMDIRATRSSLYEINTLSKAFNEMLDALEVQRRELSEANDVMARQKALAEVGKFSMTVAHEIKNPLTIIKGSLDIMKKDPPSPPELKERMAHFIDEEIARIDTLIEDFLIFAKPRSPSLQRTLVNQLVDSLSQRIHLIDKDIQVVREVSETEDCELLCDVGLLERALLNIVRNALEATSGYEPVQLKIARSEKSLVFSILDRGPGIAPDQLTEIFEPFVSHKSKGTGLGLAIAREVVDAHEGRLTAANRPDGGASFSLELPLKLPETGSEGEVPVSPVLKN